MPNLGLGELLVIGAILALLFGPSQLPRLGRSLGDTIREFRKVGKELQGDDDHNLRDRND